ncbi:MAG: hypothetical protein JNL68_02445 [Burkholderiales bacterium]|nr:hypothetical protein [Burkholderiales bacterium]
MSAAVLKAYKDEVDASFVMKDLHKYRNVPQVFHPKNRSWRSRHCVTF